MSWRSPFALPGQWLKGNLHTHTTQSDGDLTLEQAIAWYRERGYDFIAVTDHWVLTPGAHPASGDGFLTLSGAELHGAGHHMLALGLSALPDAALQDNPQALAESVSRSGGLAFFAHPYWTAQRVEEIAATSAIAGIEVFNSVCENMDGLGHASVYWDQLLRHGRRVWGLAVDDTHWRHHEEGQGFVMVKAARAREADLIQALRQGHFYASNGPQISDLRIVAQDKGAPALQVRCSPCQTITFYAHGPLGHRFEAPSASSLCEAAWPLKAEQRYLRVECRDMAGRCAWSNPVFVADVLNL